jgi:hypothetical protein
MKHTMESIHTYTKKLVVYYETHCVNNAEFLVVYQVLHRVTTVLNWVNLSIL